MNTEAERLAALQGLEVLDSAPEAIFDDLVGTACRIFNVPVALVSLVDADRQWFKACVGLDVSETRRDVAFCDHAIQQSHVMVVADARSDARFADNPLVTDAPGIRFYAGAPLKLPMGEQIGTLCLLDFVPRSDFDEGRSAILEGLAAAVVSAMLMRADLKKHRVTEAQLVAGQQEARNSSDDLRAVIDTVVDGLLIIDERGLIETVNPACVELFGYQPGEMVGRNVRMLMPESYAREHDQYLDNYRRTSEAKIIGIGREVTGRRSDGSEFPMELSVGQMRSGETRRYVGMIRDVTARHAARQSLEDSERHMRTTAIDLRAVIDTVVDGLLIIDERGLIETVNPACVEMFGYQPGEMVGRNVRMLMPENYAREHDQYLDNYSRTGEAKVIGIGREVTGRRSDGSEFPMELSVGQMRSGDRRRYVGMIRDVTARTEVDRLKSEFVSTVSHELRTPLTSINGALGLVRSGAFGELPAGALRMLDIAHSNGDRLSLLINDILDMEKIAAGRMEFRMTPVELGGLIDEAIESNRAFALGHKVDLVLAGCVENAGVRGDADRLMQVLANLLSNAVKFSPPGGVVEVRLTDQGDAYRIAVSDHGAGISEAFRPRMFHRFAQADSSDTRRKGGTGLGLNISKAIIELHSGSIDFETEIDAGTTFYVDLPKWADPARAGEASPILHTGDRVLICGVDQALVASLEAMLGAEGIPAESVTATEARALLAVNCYSALLLDSGLPDQETLRLALELQSQSLSPNMPVLVTTASEADRPLAARYAGRVEWLGRGFDQQTLATTLKRLIGASRQGRTQVLHVEDDPDIIQVVRTSIARFADLTPARSLADARRLLREQSFDLVLLDMVLPDGDATSLLPLTDPADGRQTPVIVFSAQEVSIGALKGVRAALLKSRTGNSGLSDAIRATLGLGPQPEAPGGVAA